MKASKNYILKTDLSHEDWLEGRKRYIGASETAAVLGLDRYKSPYQLWLQKTNPDNEELGGIGAQRAAAGLRAEDMIADWIADKYDIKVQRDNKIRLHERLPFWSCNLDRVIVSHAGGTAPLELKTTSRESLKSWNINADEPNPIFMHHWVQVQAQMAITGYSWGAIGVMPADSFMGFGEPELIEVERDEDFIKMAEREIEAFWNNHILTNTPPPATTIDDFKSLYPVAGPPPLEIAGEVYDQIVKLAQIKERQKAIKEEHDALDLQVKLLMGEHDSATFNGMVVLTYKNNMETIFDSSGFEKDWSVEAANCKVIDKKLVESQYPDIFEKYVSKQPGARVLRLKIKP